MALDLHGIESAISVALGQGNSGALAAGAAASGFVGNAQADLADKGAQIGSILGSLGLSGFLQSAAASANKTNTAQANALIPTGTKTTLWGLLGAGLAFAVFRVTRSLIGAAISLAGVYLVYSTNSPPPSVVVTQQAGAPPNAFAGLTNIIDGIPSFSSILSGFGWSASAPQALANTNGAPAPGIPAALLPSMPVVTTSEVTAAISAANYAAAATPPPDANTIPYYLTPSPPNSALDQTSIPGIP